MALRLPQMGRDECEESLDELTALARASGAQVVARVLQSRARVDGRTFIGSGKAEELQEVAARNDANLILIDHDLSPAQARNLEKISGLKVLDRTELILDIFARRARTPQAKLQVEVAQLEYLLPRLTRLWEHLSRLGGGIGTRGPGETQLEVDRRRIRDRLARLRRRLVSTGQRIEVQRNLHPQNFRVALVGYTSTGKSSLMNQLTEAGVDSGSRLFETLDATTRILALGNGFRATLTDTVGFVRRLPHSLVESFRATLSEVSSADLLLHVVDLASVAPEARRASVDQVLREIEAHEIPEISVYNKCDLLDTPQLEGVRKHTREGDAVLVSALYGTGLDELREAIRRHLRRGWLEKEGSMPSWDGELLSRLRGCAEILLEERADENIRLRIRVAPSEWERLRAEYEERAPQLFGA